ncbi:MAG: HAMP domain-containing protein [Firmicutes bacterium]|nr:HAMP domain-containing protein [Bacillota bacterium]
MKIPLKLPFKIRGLFGKLMITHLIVVFITLLVIGFFLTYLMQRYFFGAREWEIMAQAENVASVVQEDLFHDNLDGVNKTVRTLALSLGIKIEVLDQNGAPITISAPEKESDRAGEEDEGVLLESGEIAQVLDGNTLTKKVYSPRVQRLLVAAPVFELTEDEQNPEFANVIGAITVSAPLSSVEETIAHISRLIFYSGTIAVIIAGLIAFSLAKKITQPLQGINNAALNMAAGKYRYSKIEVDSDDEVGRLAQTFNYAVEQVEKTIREQKRLEVLRRNLVANVSHELRGPLSSMRGFAEVMIDGLLKEEEKEKYLKIILDNTIHLSRLVDDLLELSNLESGNLSLKYEQFSLQELAEWSYQNIYPKCKEKGVSLHLEVEQTLPLIWGDRSRLHEVQTNLLDNALQHTPPGGDIWLKVYNYLSNLVVMEVKDTGSGIPSEDLPHIWERFYKVDKSRRKSSGGTGLGLAITKQLVELHRGKIEVESSSGLGSTFRVYLPKKGL